MSRTVSFTVSEELRRKMDSYAAEKGFRTASDLARYATVQHMKRYQAHGHRNGTKVIRDVQPNTAGDKSEASE
jgi:Arc/MetJ-type ribon-helix-helix transcriptional regulator